MTAFSTWAHHLKDHLASLGVMIPLGHAHELLAAGLKHNTRASLLALEGHVLPHAQHVVFLDDALRNRATTLGIDLSPLPNISKVLDILDDPDEKLSPAGVHYLLTPRANGPISNSSFRNRIFLLVEECEHELQHTIARQLNGVRAKTMVNWLENEEPVVNRDGDWEWTFSGFTRLADSTVGYQVPVSGTIVLRKVGRRLLGSARLTKLERTGAPQPFDDDMDQGDVYGYDGSD